MTASVRLATTLAMMAMMALPWLPSRAEEPTRIDLTYDSVMDMVRPENHPGIKVHHNLHIRVANGDILAARRDRRTGHYADRNATMQVLEDTGEDASGVHWRVASNGTLVREQNFAQSTRTMTVTFLPGHTCRLDVVDRLKPGFKEYEFLRLKVHEMGYYSSYTVIATSCRLN